MVATDRPLHWDGCSYFPQATSPFGRGRSRLSDRCAHLRFRPEEGLWNSGYPLPSPLPKGEGATIDIKNAPTGNGEVRDSLPPPWGGGGFEGALATEKTGAGIPLDLVYDRLRGRIHDALFPGTSTLGYFLRCLRHQEFPLLREAEEGVLFATPSPCPLPLGSGGEGANNSSHRRTEGVGMPTLNHS